MLRGRLRPSAAPSRQRPSATSPLSLSDSTRLPPGRSRAALSAGVQEAGVGLGGVLQRAEGQGVARSSHSTRRLPRRPSRSSAAMIGRPRSRATHRLAGAGAAGSGGNRPLTFHSDLRCWLAIETYAEVIPNSNPMTARIAPARPRSRPTSRRHSTRSCRPASRRWCSSRRWRATRRLRRKFFAASLLDRRALSLRERELVIDRTTALCRSEYEWGVHVAIFAPRSASRPSSASLVHGGPEDACWHGGRPPAAAPVRCLHHDATVDDALWQSPHDASARGALIELLMVAGFYRTVSSLTNALRLPLEPTRRASRPRHPGLQHRP